MNTFQVILLAILVPGTFYCLHGWLSRRRRRLALAALVLTACGITMAVPSVTQRCAEFLGIGRGADLVSYLAALAVIGCYSLTLYSHRRLRLQITELTRQLALTQFDAQRRQWGTHDHPS